MTSLDPLATSYVIHSLVGSRVQLADDLADAVEGAMVARLLRNAYGAKLTSEELDHVQAVLFCWTWAAREGRLDREQPLSFGVEVAEVADMAGHSQTRSERVLRRLAERALIELPQTDRPSGEGRVLEVNLAPLLGCDHDGTASDLRRMWSTRHFRDIRAAWIERVGTLDDLFSPGDYDDDDELPFASDDVLELLHSRWAKLKCRDLAAVEGLFRAPWDNCELIYEGFEELAAFDDQAYFFTAGRGVYEPLSGVISKHAGARAQVRRDKALGLAL